MPNNVVYVRCFIIFLAMKDLTPLCTKPSRQEIFIFCYLTKFYCLFLNIKLLILLWKCLTFLSVSFRWNIFFPRITCKRNKEVTKITWKTACLKESNVNYRQGDNNSSDVCILKHVPRYSSLNKQWDIVLDIIHLDVHSGCTSAAINSTIYGFHNKCVWRLCLIIQWADWGDHTSLWVDCETVAVWQTVEHLGSHRLSFIIVRGLQN